MNCCGRFGQFCNIKRTTSCNNFLSRGRWESLKLLFPEGFAQCFSGRQIMQILFRNTGQVITLPLINKNTQECFHTQSQSQIASIPSKPLYQVFATAA